MPMLQKRLRTISIGWGKDLKDESGKTILYALLKGGAQILAAVVFLLVVWWIAYLAADNRLVVPALSDSIKSAWKMLGNGWFWQCFFSTFYRVLFAFILSFVFAVSFAVISYLVPAISNFLVPIMAALRSLPVLAVTLILLISFGAGGAPIIVAFLSLFPMLYTGILAALKGIDKELLDIGKVYGASVKNKIFKVYLPLTTPYILREGGAALSFSLKLVVSAEVVASTAKSLGGMMQEAQAYSELPKLFALVVVTFIAALCLEMTGNWVAEYSDKKLK
jgi:NitT/TauT family transport system permease protein